MFNWLFFRTGTPPPPIPHPSNKQHLHKHTQILTSYIPMSPSELVQVIQTPNQHKQVMVTKFENET